MPFDVIRRLRIEDPEAGPAHVVMVFRALSALALLLAAALRPSPLVAGACSAERRR